MKQTFLADVNDRGEMSWANPQSLQVFLRRVAGKKVRIGIELWRKKRSPAQRRFFHGVLVRMISDHSGNDTAEVHSAVKHQFPEYFRRWATITGKDGHEVEIDHWRSYEDLTTAEQEELNEKLRAWALDFFGLDLPLPNEARWEDL